MDTSSVRKVPHENHLNDQFKQPCLSTEVGIYSSPEASCSLPYEYGKHFNKTQSSAPTRGVPETSQAGKKQNKLCFLGKGAGQPEKKRTALPASS